jgi:hypothetical protein
MTATTIPPTVTARTWSGLLRLAVLLAVALVLIAGSFAIGRSTADDGLTVVRPVVPVAGTATIDDLPPVSLHTRTAPADVPPVATDASCGHTAHTAPC